MKRVIFSLTFFALVLMVTSSGFALFSDVAEARDNRFSSGGFNLQLNTTDADNNGIADAASANWSDITTNVWTTSLYWLPGDTKRSVIFLRNNGTVDAQSLKWSLAQRSYTGASHLDEVVNLTEAWYDRNANGILDAGEDILPALKTTYGSGTKLTLEQLYEGTKPTGGTPYELEPGTEVLPGGSTNTVIGGYGGTGKGLFLTWQFEPTAGTAYQDSSVELDLVFSATQ